MNRVSCYMLRSTQSDKDLHRVVDTCTGQYKYAQGERHIHRVVGIHRGAELCTKQQVFVRVQVTPDH